MSYDQTTADLLNECATLRATLATVTTEREALREDAARLDWLESLMHPADGYCEVFFAGLRSVANGKLTAATAYQFETNPMVIPTLNAPTLRAAIDAARATEAQ